MNRPGGVTVIAILEFLGGVACILIGLAVMLGGGMLAAVVGQSGGQGSGAGAGILGALGAALGIVLLVFALLYFLVGWGMLKLKGWARIISMIFAGLSILGSLFGITGFLAHFNVVALFWLVVRLAIAGWIIWYLMQPNVSAAFNGGQTRTASA